MPGVEEEKGWGDAAPAAPLASASWGSQLDLLTGSQEDILDLNYGEGDDIISNLLRAAGRAGTLMGSYSGRNPIPRASTLDCEAVDRLGLLRPPQPPWSLFSPPIFT